MASRSGKLTPKQARFVAEYLIDSNATQAAKRAGFSPKTCGDIGAQLLRKTHVQQAIAARQERVAKKLEVTQERIVAEYAKIAFADPRAAASWGPGGVVLKDSSELTDDQAAAVAEVSETKSENGGGSMKFKLHDKVAALNALGKHLGMFVEKHEHEVKVSLASILAKAGGGA